MSDELEVGDVVGDGLKVVGVLGRGGFAIVYEVAKGDEHLAMKVMKRKHVEKKETVARFFREAAVIRELASPHLPTIHDVGELPDGRPFILMERLQGRSLREVLRGEGPLEAPRVARIGAQICAALSAAHDRGALHRDLKPANLFLVGEGDDEKVMVLDFGVATFVAGFTDSYGALTKTNAIVGTPHYMSPEQIRAKTLDGRSDLYMLGAVLYELLTGSKPFEGETLGLLLAAIHTGGYAPVSRLAPTTPKALVGIIDKALSHEPFDRFASAIAMQRALVAAENAPPELGPRPSRRPTMPAKPSTPTAETAETRDDTPDRLPRAQVDSTTESMPPGIPRPPLRIPIVVAVLALIAIGGFVVHWLSQPPESEEEEIYDPDTETIVRSGETEVEPAMTMTEIPDEMPTGVTPPNEAPAVANPPRMVRSVPMSRAETTEMTSMEPPEHVAPPQNTMMGPASADMRGDLLDPFGG